MCAGETGPTWPHCPPDPEAAVPGLPGPQFLPSLPRPAVSHCPGRAPRPCPHSAWLSSGPSSRPVHTPCPFPTCLCFQDSAPGPLLHEAFPAESPHSDATLYLLVKGLTPRAWQLCSLHEDKDQSRVTPLPDTQHSLGRWRLPSASLCGTKPGSGPGCRAPSCPRGRKRRFGKPEPQLLSLTDPQATTGSGPTSGLRTGPGRQSEIGAQDWSSGLSPVLLSSLPTALAPPPACHAPHHSYLQLILLHGTSSRKVSLICREIWTCLCSN